jgi:hypothetical protein
VGDIVSESPGDFISVRLGDFIGIRKLKQSEDVEEPTTAAHREVMELTSDRQGVTGKPRRPQGTID